MRLFVIIIIIIIIMEFRKTRRQYGRVIAVRVRHHTYILIKYKEVGLGAYPLPYPQLKGQVSTSAPIKPL